MSARSQRGSRETPATKKFPTPRINAKNRLAKARITYDYDAAVSQPDVPNFLDFKKDQMKRSQVFRRSVSKHAKMQSSKKSECDGKEAELSSVSEEEQDVGEKENFTGNADAENSAKFTKKKLMGSKNVSRKEERIEGMKNLEGEKNVEDQKGAAKSPVLQIKGSRIPRAKIVAFPVHVYHETNSARKTDDKTKGAVQLDYPTRICCSENVQISEKEVTAEPRDENQNFRQEEIIRLKQEIRADKEIKIDYTEGRTSGTEADEEVDYEITSTDESPAIIGNMDDPRVLNILKSLKLNCPCKSCSDRGPLAGNQREGESDLKSSPPEEYRKKKWIKSFKHRKYIDSTSEEASSDYNSEESKKRRKNRKMKSFSGQSKNSNSMVNVHPKASNRQGRSFSFFNTLFDIVFWPYVFLKTNR